MSVSVASTGGETIRLRQAIERFKRYIRFDPQTGCVLWTGGTTGSHGGTRRVGAFKFEGRRWTAHRWAAKHIHGFDIEGKHVYQDCDNPLCVQHLSVAEPSEPENLIRQRFLLVRAGIIEPSPAQEAPDHGIAFHTKPPEWTGLPEIEETEDVPF